MGRAEDGGSASGFSELRAELPGDLELPGELGEGIEKGAKEALEDILFDW